MRACSATRAHAARPPAQVDDYAEFAGDVRAKFASGAGAPPAFAAGQSMGGLLATHLVLRDQAAWAGLILCSAAIDLEWNLVTRRAARHSRPASQLHVRGRAGRAALPGGLGRAHAGTALHDRHGVEPRHAAFAPAHASYLAARTARVQDCEAGGARCGGIAGRAVRCGLPLGR